mgnify:CR=1 FL=1
MREDVIDEIEKYLDGDMAELPFATKEKIGCTVDYTAGRNRYMGYLMSLAIYSLRERVSVWMPPTEVHGHLPRAFLMRWAQRHT